jgi:glutamate racemase
LVEKGADILVLGCTHYPFVRALIQEIAGPEVDIIDPAAAVARELRRRLETGSLLNPDRERGTEQFWTTGEVDTVGLVMNQLWGSPIVVSGFSQTTRSA